MRDSEFVSNPSPFHVMSPGAVTPAKFGVGSGHGALVVNKCRSTENKNTWWNLSLRKGLTLR